MMAHLPVSVTINSHILLWATAGADVIPDYYSLLSSMQRLIKHHPGMCDADASTSVVWIDREHLPLLFVGRVVIEVEGLSREVAKPVVIVL